MKPTPQKFLNSKFCPEWVRWCAMNQDLSISIYEYKPHKTDDEWHAPFISNKLDINSFVEYPKDTDWKDSLIERKVAPPKGTICHVWNDKDDYKKNIIIVSSGELEENCLSCEKYHWTKWQEITDLNYFKGKE